jgi:cation transport regulator
MSYTIDNPPERIKGLPRHAQEIWIATYNNALKQYGDNEEKLNAIAWAAVKQKYEKDERGRWVLIDNSEGIMSVNTELHGRVPDEIQVIPFGRHNTSKGDFELDESSAAQVVTEFNSKTTPDTHRRGGPCGGLDKEAHQQGARWNMGRCRMDGQGKEIHAEQGIPLRISGIPQEPVNRKGSEALQCGPDEPAQYRRNDAADQ